MIVSRENIDNKQEIARIEYENAIPFSHVCIDNLFEPTFLSKIIDDIIILKTEKWWKYNNIFEKKNAYNNFQKMSSNLQEYFNFVNGVFFTRFLQNISGIDNLVSDPSLYGGGIHRIERGGKLDIHEDFSYHKITGWKRKLNVITYLNKNWKEEYNGHTEFWNKNMDKCCKKILPVFNRTVLFSTDQNSLHGHPEPLNCPETMERLSLASYYYILDNSYNESTNNKSTAYKKRPGDKTSKEIEQMRIDRSQGRLKS